MHVTIFSKYLTKKHMQSIRNAKLKPKLFIISVSRAMLHSTGSSSDKRYTGELGSDSGGNEGGTHIPRGNKGERVLFRIK